MVFENTLRRIVEEIGPGMADEELCALKQTMLTLLDFDRGDVDVRRIDVRRRGGGAGEPEEGGDAEEAAFIQGAAVHHRRHLQGTGGDGFKS